MTSEVTHSAEPSEKGGAGHDSAKLRVPDQHGATSLPTAPAVPTDDPALLHFLRRTSFGATRENLERARLIGPLAYLAEQLFPPPAWELEDEMLVATIFPHLHAATEKYWVSYEGHHLRWRAACRLALAEQGERSAERSASSELDAAPDPIAVLHEPWGQLRAALEGTTPHSRPLLRPLDEHISGLPDLTAATYGLAAKQRKALVGALFDPEGEVARKNKDAEGSIKGESSNASATARSTRSSHEGFRGPEHHEIQGDPYDPRDYEDEVQSILGEDHVQGILGEDENPTSRGRAFALQRATILRRWFSQRQLYEVMVDFWSNHFNIYIDTNNPTREFKLLDDRIIREHAMGNFREMLYASASSPAMMHYLDTIDNKLGIPERPAQKANENFARELLELHTLGVDPKGVPRIPILDLSWLNGLIMGKDPGPVVSGNENEETNQSSQAKVEAARAKNQPHEQLEEEEEQQASIEAAVRVAARCFAGWQLAPAIPISNDGDDKAPLGEGPQVTDAIPQGEAARIKFKFRAHFHDEESHDADNKNFLGFPVVQDDDPEDQSIGLEGVRVIEILLNHPSTPNFLAAKLVQRFLGDAYVRDGERDKDLPEPQEKSHDGSRLVKAVASTLIASGYDVRSALLVVLTSQEFFESMGHKTQKPSEFAVAAIRVMRPIGNREVADKAANQLAHHPGETMPNSRAKTTQDLLIEHLGNQETLQDWLTVHVMKYLKLMGHLPFDWRTPDGYPEASRHWQTPNGMLQRWRFAQDLSNDDESLGKLIPRINTIPGGVAKEAESLAQQESMDNPGQAREADAGRPSDADPVNIVAEHVVDDLVATILVLDPSSHPDSGFDTIKTKMVQMLEGAFHAYSGEQGRSVPNAVQFFVANKQGRMAIRNVAALLIASPFFQGR